MQKKGETMPSSISVLFRREKQPEQAEEIWYRRLAERSSEAAQRYQEGRNWFSQQNPSRVQIGSGDGLKLSARLLMHPNSRGTFILVHGFHSCPEHDFAAAFSYIYQTLQCSILAVDQRVHGESEGDTITYGLREHDDVVRWCQWQHKELGENAVIWGVSMGCASTLLAAATGQLPENVRCLVADCGYINMREEFLAAGKQMHYPAFLIGLLNLFYCRRLGFSMKQVDVEREVPKITLPVLFVHGTDDHLVPVEHSQRAYTACTAPKQLLLVENAEHGMAYSTDTPAYQRELERFLKENGF